MNSLWTETVKIDKRPVLDADKKTDVLIIGAGLAGILCAYFLKQEGVECLVVDAGKIGGVTTSNTTGKITFQHGLIYDKLIKSASFEKAKRYLHANRKAFNKFSELCKSIDCDFEKKPAYIYSLDNRKAIEDEVKAVQSLGFNASFIQEISLPFKVAGAIKFENQAQFHPLKFLKEISKDLTIFENTPIEKIKDNTAYTEKNKITARKIIIASHFPFIDLYGFYFMKMYQHRSYVIAVEDGQDIGGMYVDEKENGMSFRNYGSLLLIGGGDHRTGKKGGGYGEIRNFSKKHYPDGTEKYSWAAQDCISLDSVPYIGLYSRATPDLYVASGFNKWGMTSSMVSAMILTDLILERKNPYGEVFSPSRSILKPKLISNMAEAVVHLINPTTKRCTHLGCGLKWNSLEGTWDCPCHGSRFEVNGKIINNPATKEGRF